MSGGSRDQRSKIAHVSIYGKISTNALSGWKGPGSSQRKGGSEFGVLLRGYGFPEVRLEAYGSLDQLRDEVTVRA